MRGGDFLPEDTARAEMEAIESQLKAFDKDVANYTILQKIDKKMISLTKNVSGETKNTIWYEKLLARIHRLYQECMDAAE